MGAQMAGIAVEKTVKPRAGAFPVNFPSPRLREFIYFWGVTPKKQNFHTQLL
jgi:hypothetical protein